MTKRPDTPTVPGGARDPLDALRYSRTEDPAEFNRIITISDGVFAIALTLLVFTISVPVDIPARELPAQLRQVWPQVLSFFLSFAIISQYWLAHHRLFGLLEAIDGPFLFWHFVYLAFIALLPFPTELVGEFGRTAVGTISYALCAGTVSALETVLIFLAARRGLLRHTLPPDRYRYWLSQSLSPVAIFALSIPVALWEPFAAIATWVVLARPAGALAARLAPKGAR